LRFIGQVYYTLLEERRKRGIRDIAISRVEQISPFPYDLVSNYACDESEVLIVVVGIRLHQSWIAIPMEISSGVRCVAALLYNPSSLLSMGYRKSH
jgi:2-oxoglutarate dehydrogenase C-terminal